REGGMGGGRSLGCVVNILRPLLSWILPPSHVHPSLSSDRQSHPPGPYCLLPLHPTLHRVLPLALLFGVRAGNPRLPRRHCRAPRIPPTFQRLPPLLVHSSYPGARPVSGLGDETEQSREPEQAGGGGDGGIACTGRDCRHPRRQRWGHLNFFHSRPLAGRGRGKGRGKRRSRADQGVPSGVGSLGVGVGKRGRAKGTAGRGHRGSDGGDHIHGMEAVGGGGDGVGGRVHRAGGGRGGGWGSAPFVVKDLDRWPVNAVG
ncbi:hypothetical protein Naga_100331g1, partial [Nannochloropsis gaditana]